MWRPASAAIITSNSSRSPGPCDRAPESYGLRRSFGVATPRGKCRPRSEARPRAGSTSRGFPQYSWNIVLQKSVAQNHPHGGTLRPVLVLGLKARPSAGSIPRRVQDGVPDHGRPPVDDTWTADCRSIPDDSEAETTTSMQEPDPGRFPRSRRSSRARLTARCLRCAQRSRPDDQVQGREASAKAAHSQWKKLRCSLPLTRPASPPPSA